MFKRLLMSFVVLAGVLLVFSSGQAQNVPTEVLTALSALSQEVGQNLTLTDLYRYKWDDSFYSECGVTNGRSVRAIQVKLVYNYIEYVYQVPSGTQTARLCSQALIDATPTFTPSATSTLTPTATFTPTITYTPSPTPRPGIINCPDALPSLVLAGDLAHFLISSGLQEEPAADSQQLKAILPGTEISVLSGPECVTGQTWWQVDFNGSVGWTLEAENDTYYLEPIILPSPTPTITPSPTATATRTPSPTYTATPIITCPGFLPSRLAVGGNGWVTPGDPNRLREKPSADSDQIGQIYGGKEFKVLDGPVCDPAGRAWWKVDASGVIGWTVEGQGNSYFVEPIP